MATLGRRERAPWQRAVGWRPATLAAEYDVAVVGDGALAVATAWSLTTGDPQLRVAVLVPNHLAMSWDPAAAGRLHALRTPAEVAALMPTAASRLRTWADQLGIEPPRVRGGHVVAATSTSSWVALRAAAGRVPSCRSLDGGEQAQLLAGLDGSRVLAAWHEPLATTMDLGSLIFRLAEAASGAGVDLVDEAAIISLTAVPDGFEVVTTAGRARVRTVVDADPYLSVSRAAGLGGTLVAASHERLTTAAMAPLLELGVTVDDTDVVQRPTGEIDVVAPLDGMSAGDGLGAAAPTVQAVLAVLPELATARVVDRCRNEEAMATDRLPVVGALARGLWSCGGLGRHRLDLLPVMVEALRDAVIDGALPAGLEAFSPDRLGRLRSPVLSSAPRWNCPTCGARDRSEFLLVGGRVVHRSGCGRPLGAAPATEVVIDLRDPAPRRVSPPARQPVDAIGADIASVGQR